MYALALPHPTLAHAIADALAPARVTQVRDGALGGRCLVCGGLTRLVTHAGVLEAPLPTRLRLISSPGDD